MNYFSHFWVDGKNDHHFYNVGLILPDFARKQVKSFLKPPVFNQANHEQLHQGCLAHYHADKLFHQSVFFTTLLHQANVIINSAPFSAGVNRKWFLAHIFVELMLDRLLTKAYKPALDSFYHSLEQVSENELSDFLTLYGASDIDLFIRHYNHFRSARYIYFYPDNIKFVYSLNRIMIRAGAGELGENDQHVLLQAVLYFEEQLSLQLPELFNQLKLSVHD
ncbi:MAG: hypothetical protein EAY81_05220 [Bacteroidetes bacterium]|nr:MAG: hypothetical protein EAY81_05220 [Bacteroidota bacterium]